MQPRGSRRLVGVPRAKRRASEADYAAGNSTTLAWTESISSKVRSTGVDTSLFLLRRYQVKSIRRCSAPRWRWPEVHGWYADQLLTDQRLHRIGILQRSTAGRSSSPSTPAGRSPVEPGKRRHGIAERGCWRRRAKAGAGRSSSPAAAAEIGEMSRSVQQQIVSAAKLPGSTPEIVGAGQVGAIAAWPISARSAWVGVAAGKEPSPAGGGSWHGRGLGGRAGEDVVRAGRHAMLRPADDQISWPSILGRGGLDGRAGRVRDPSPTARWTMDCTATLLSASNAQRARCWRSKQAVLLADAGAGMTAGLTSPARCASALPCWKKV